MEIDRTGEDERSSETTTSARRTGFPRKAVLGRDARVRATNLFAARWQATQRNATQRSLTQCASSPASSQPRSEQLLSLSTLHFPALVRGHAPAAPAVDPFVSCGSSHLRRIEPSTATRGVAALTCGCRALQVAAVACHMPPGVMAKRRAPGETAGGERYRGSRGGNSRLLVWNDFEATYTMDRS